MNASCFKHEIKMHKTIKRLEDKDIYLFRCPLCGPNRGVIVET